MKPSVKSKIKAFQESAKGKKKVHFTLKSGGRDSLSEVIKTKEQGDLFMKILKSL